MIPSREAPKPRSCLAKSFEAARLRGSRNPCVQNLGTSAEGFTAQKTYSSEVLATCKTLQSRILRLGGIALNHPALAPGCLFIGSPSDVPGSSSDSLFSDPQLNPADCQSVIVHSVIPSDGARCKLSDAVFWCSVLWKATASVPAGKAGGPVMGQPTPLSTVLLVIIIIRVHPQNLPEQLLLLLVLPFWLRAEC